MKSPAKSPLKQTIVSLSLALSGMTLLFSSVTQAEPEVESLSEKPSFEAQSQAVATNIIHLFTSEGCSSCPPADAWLSTYRGHEGLWQSVIPLAFHVDYWDYIGWEDPFAHPANSSLQRQFRRERILGSVYTPGLLVNNNEFRQWFRGQREWPESRSVPGKLKANVDGFEARIEFNAAEDNGYQVHAAWVGMGLKSNVLRGENTGRLLEHDFVVLSHKDYRVQVKNGRSADLRLGQLPNKGQVSSTLVIWVTEEDSSAIVQALAVPLDSTQASFYIENESVASLN